ncbi:MAG: acyl-CoA/acyl-ACP dehydrogenase, partial [Acidimicrobiales bacterium]|nr:acyl-CoA/acyl-ACP dehydrogenase [Acidimicrobiales bacterium]
MDFELTDDQIELQQVVRDIAAKECPTTLVRAVVAGDDDAGALWRTYVGLDWPTLAVPEADGGTGLTFVELVILLEELGWVADPTPLVATTSQYTPLVREGADADQRATLLGAVCQGGTGAAAFAAADVRATPDGHGWRLAGTAHHVVDGDRADEVAVVAATDEGPATFVVPRAEVAATRLPAFDPTMHVADVSLDGALVPPERVLRQGGEEAIARARHEAVTGMAAVMVGASRRMLELVLAHVTDRHQFGVPIGSFQAVKHMAVDVHVAIERARALCHFAALVIAEGDDRRALAASMAKAAAGDCQRIAARHGVQLFGGLGYTW